MHIIEKWGVGAEVSLKKSLNIEEATVIRLQGRNIHIIERGADVSR